MEQDVWHPVRCSCHLLAERFQGYFLGTFDNQFIVDMTANKAVGECFHSIHQKVSGDGLYHILDKFRTVAFQAFLLFSGSDTFIGYRFSTEFILANAWFDVSELSDGWKSNE